MVTKIVMLIQDVTALGSDWSFAESGSGWSVAAVGINRVKVGGIGWLSRSRPPSASATLRARARPMPCPEAFSARRMNSCEGHPVPLDAQTRTDRTIKKVAKSDPRAAGGSHPLVSLPHRGNRGDPIVDFTRVFLALRGKPVLLWRRPGQDAVSGMSSS